MIAFNLPNNINNHDGWSKTKNIYGKTQVINGRLTNKKSLYEYYDKYSLHRVHNLCAVNHKYNVSYLYIPKCGSTTFRYLIWNNTGNNSQTVLCDNNSKYYKFTFIRDPMYRIISAYSTIIKRGNFIYIKNNKEYHGISTPNITLTRNNMSIWRRHFNEEIKYIINTLSKYYESDIDIYWNEHIMKVVDFLKGHNLNYIGCIYGTDGNNKSIDDKLTDITMNGMRHIYNVTGMESFNIKSIEKRNSHERNETTLPLNVNDYANIKYLSNENKQLIQKFYVEDFQLFHELCVKSLEFNYLI